MRLENLALVLLVYLMVASAVAAEYCRDVVGWTLVIQDDVAIIRRGYTTEGACSLPESAPFELVRHLTCDHGYVAEVMMADDWIIIFPKAETPMVFERCE